MKLLVLLLLSSAAFSQAFIGNRIPDNTGPAEPPGYVYNDTTLYSNSYFFEIGFRIDSTKFDAAETSICGGWIPEGYWLFDRHPNNENGRWMIGVGGNQRLCFQDQPMYSWGFGQFQLQFDTQLDTCHLLTATRSSNGVLTVTLDGVSQTVNEWSGDVSYRGGVTGIGVGREVNGFDYWTGSDSFPGDVYYLNDNGNILTFVAEQVTGNASIGASACSTGAPPPPPPPPQTACDTDPNSAACACETTPHPACDVCLAP